MYFWSGTIQKYFKKKIQYFSFSTKLIKAHLKTIKFLSMKGQRYTEFAKGFLKACQYFGISAYRVSKEFDIPKSTACRLYKELKNVKLEDNLYKKQKPAHMKLEDLHKRGVRNILRAVKKNPKITIDKLCTLLISGQTVSRNVIRRILRRNRFKFRVPSSRPYLKKSTKKKRRLWAKTYKNYTTFDWATVVWSDESNFEIGFSTRKQPQWIQNCTKRNGKSLVITRPTVPGNRRKVGIWGAFSGAGTSDLYVLPQGATMNHQLYLEVLENNLLPFIEKTKQKFPGKSVIFMQDGARYHWHKDVKEWFLNHDIETMIWPPQSPDLNPIEHIWGNMKKELSMKNPYVTSYVEMTFILSNLWFDLKQVYLNKLIESMPRRVHDVMINHGGNTSH